MPTRTAHDVTHFRHCGRLKSMATNQGDMYLTAGVSGGSVSGALTVEPLTSNGTDDDGFNQAWWLSSDYGATASGIAGNFGVETWDGDTYIRTTINVGGNVTYTYPSSSGATLTLSNSLGGTNLSPSPGDTIATFNIVAASPDGFVIYARNSDLCLTAGTSASDTISSQNITPRFVTYAGKANQRWELEAIEALAGIYQLAPCLQPDFAISSPGQATSENSRLGIGAYDERDVTATWHVPIITQYMDALIGPWKMLSIPAVIAPKSTELFTWAAPSDTTPPCPIYQRRWLDPYDSLKLTSTNRFAWYQAVQTAFGTYNAWQYRLDDTPNVLSSELDGQRVDSLAWGQTLSSLQTEANYPQYWYRFPRNVYRADLPQPYDIKLWMWDYNASSGRYLESLDHIDPTHRIRLEPHFVCSSGAYVVTIRLTSESSSSTWTKTVLPDNSAVWEGVKRAPYANIDTGIAWAPNAFVSSRDEDDYIQLDSGFEFPSGLWSGSPNAPIRISVTIRAFSYDNGSQGQDAYEPWRPYQGMSSTAEFRVAKRYAPSISSMTIDDTDLILTWTGNNYEAMRRDTDTIRFDHIDVQWTDADGTHVGDLLLDSYDCLVLRPQGGSKTLRIPLTELNADIAIAVISSLASGGSVKSRNQGDWTLMTQYGPIPLPTASFSPGIPVTMETGATSYTTSATASRFSTTFPSPSGTQLLTHAYARAMTERGPRLIEMPVLATSATSRIAVWADGGYLNAHEGPRRSIIFARLSSSPNTLYYSTSIDSLVITNPVSSLSWQTSDRAIHLILLDGNLSFSYARQRDVASAIRRGGQRYLAASAGTEVPSLKFSGTIYRGQRSIASTSDIVIHDSIDDLYRIPDDEPVTFRTSYGTTYPVIITAIDSPRNISGLAQVSISMLEVEDS